MLFVPGGEFKMGDDKNDLEEVKPVHTVILDGFWIDRTEVTNGQYQQCVQEGACDPPIKSHSSSRISYYGNETFNNYPVIYVDWYQASNYCAWAGTRLPTEAEWEYAARGKKENHYPWGEEAPTCERANHWDWEGGCVGDTVTVASHPTGTSWAGVYDMAGNVDEWVADWYASYQSESQKNPEGPSSGTKKVLRGGSWAEAPFCLLSTFRISSAPNETKDYYGFRCATN